MKNQTDIISPEIVEIQSWLRPALTPVLQNQHHDALVDELTWLDRSLRQTGVEDLALSFVLDGLPDDVPAGTRNRKCEFALYALRVELLRHLLGCPGFEAFSMTLASSDLLTDFCGCRSIEGIRWTSKSSLHRASTQFSEDQLRQLNVLLIQAAGNREFCPQLGLKQPEDLSVCLVDSTCLPANIHFPVDWVLLSDVAKTLLKATTLIRNEGLKNRMPEEPKAFISNMNQLCIEMTNCKRKAGAKKQRKNVLRRMKTLLQKIGNHAEKHRKLLDEKVASTKYTRTQADRILERMDRSLELLPKVIKQAHERIIGERQIKNEDKILSAHEPDIDVIVRGKAGAQVEFGNELFLAESPGGLIIDYMLYSKGAPSESEKMIESVERQQDYHAEVTLQKLVADRGFDTKKANEELESQGITSYICPKNPAQLHEQLDKPDFSQWQKRRGGTEARIAIIKNHGGGRVWRAKGLKNREIAVGWSVLAHNLSWANREAIRQATEPPTAKAA